MTHSTAPKAVYDRARYLRLRRERRALLPPDPISQLTQDQCAYIAGLIDGEGCILVKEYKRANRVTVYPEIAVRMTSHAVLAWLQEVTGAPKLGYSRPRTSKYTGHVGKAQWVYRMSGKRAQALCRVLLPYMKVKHGQAALVLQFPCDARIAPGIKLEQAEVNPIRYQLKTAISALNR